MSKTHAHRDSTGDVVVSFDAFKVSRWDDAGSVHWEVHPLTRWARELLTVDGPNGFEQLAGTTGGVAHTRDDGGLYFTHATFTRRMDALQFVDYVMSAAW